MHTYLNIVDTIFEVNVSTTKSSDGLPLMRHHAVEIVENVMIDMHPYQQVQSCTWQDTCSSRWFVCCAAPEQTAVQLYTTSDEPDSQMPLLCTFVAGIICHECEV